MAALTYSVSTTEISFLTTSTILVENYAAVCIKNLTVSLDPLVDPSIISPTRAYYQT